ncbi:MAG: class I SAM-dependent rRNA methyltransferase [Chloroflexota bacterium]
MTEGIIVIKKGKEKPIQNMHPWIFSGAIQYTDNDPQPGDIVQIVNSKGDFMGRGYYNPTSQIRVRILTWQDDPIDADWWRKSIRRAVMGRLPHQEALGSGEYNAVRLINAESDYMPGLVVDRYGDWLVLQSLTLGIDVRKNEIAEILAEILKPQGIYERSDVDVRQKEGLTDVTGVLWGDEPPEFVIIEENTLRFPIDLRGGHKTGFYLDQRENRGWLHDLLYFDTDEQEDDDRRVLNMFSYTGGFGLYALAAGVNEVINVDSSVPALDIAEATVDENELPLENANFISGDAFEVLRDYAANNEQFDVVVLDPPKFAQSKKQVDGATRGYKDLNLHAFKIIKPGGYLFTFSCSGAISRDLFQKVVFGALADSGRHAQIVRHLGSSDDHPVALTFPEGEYLKGFVLRVW